MDPGAEGQHPGLRALGADVEAVGLDPVAVGVPGRDEHDRAGRKRDAAVLDLGDRDPGGERRDRLVAERLVDRGQREPVGIRAQQLPLVGVLGEQPDRVGELALAGVHAADEHVEDEVSQLVVVQPLALGLGRDQVGDQVDARVLAPRRDQRVGPDVELRDRLLDQPALGGQAPGVELALDPVGPVVQARRVGQRRAHHVGDHQRRVGLGELLDELAVPVLRQAVDQLAEESPHRRAVAIDGARGQRRVDEVAQPTVVGATDVDDVLDHLLVQRPVGDPEQLGDRQAGEDRVLGPQEVLARGSIEHHEAERARRQPPVVSLHRGHRVAVALAAQRRVGVIEHRKLELGRQRHRDRRPSQGLRASSRATASVSSSAASTVVKSTFSGVSVIRW